MKMKTKIVAVILALTMVGGAFLVLMGGWRHRKSDQSIPIQMTVSDETEFDIPALPVSDAANLLKKTTGVSITWDWEAGVSGPFDERTRPVKGFMSLTQAVQRMLVNTAHYLLPPESRRARDLDIMTRTTILPADCGGAFKGKTTTTLDDVMQFHIPAMKLIDALTCFSLESGSDVYVDRGALEAFELEAQLDTINAPEVAESSTALDAIGKLLGPFRQLHPAAVTYGMRYVQLTVEDSRLGGGVEENGR